MAERGEGEIGQSRKPYRAITNQLYEPSHNASDHQIMPLDSPDAAAGTSSAASSSDGCIADMAAVPDDTSVKHIR
jgi:hypothetical protein